MNQPSLFDEAEIEAAIARMIAALDGALEGS
jgi:hypothetical protein